MLRIFAYLDFYWKKKLLIIILLTLIATAEILNISKKLAISVKKVINNYFINTNS